MKVFRITMIASLLLTSFSGMAAATVTIETVPVGNPGNAGELSGAGAGGHGPDRVCGAVGYTYQIGRYEITVGQYTAFLNAVARTDTNGLYIVNMSFAPNQWQGGAIITRSGSAGSYSYSVAPEWANRPMNWVSWSNAVRFANWMHNGQPNTGVQNTTTTEDGSYNLQVTGVPRKLGATWVIPTEDEWYKAAYHKNDGVTGNYWDYPTATNTPPDNSVVNPDSGNNANISVEIDWISYELALGSPYYRSTVGDFENSSSPYGTFDQGGNVEEWTETADTTAGNRFCRGGYFLSYSSGLHSAYRNSLPETRTDDDRGFRLVLVTPPAVQIETVPVGNPGNAGELSGAGAGGSGTDRICGAVNYTYQIGKYEITAGQYTAFLNAVARTDAYGLYLTSMGRAPSEPLFGCGITRTGAAGSYSYSVASDWVNRPVNYVVWNNAARFANWLHNGQPNTGVQDLSTTEDGSYYLNGATTDAALMAVVRKPNATWVIPTEDEWYKAAYHKNDGVTGNYWDYPTGSNTFPSNDLINPDPGNNANFTILNDCVQFTGYDRTIGYPYYLTIVGEFENSESPYGTFDQGGNVLEWTETVLSSTTRVYRGADYYFDAYCGGAMHAAYRRGGAPTYGTHTFNGFRVALVTTPTAITLTMTVSPTGSGTTTPAAGGTYPYSLNDVVSISATPASGYRFLNWVGGVANPLSATTTVTMDASKVVTAVFERIQLTMAVRPAGTGTTTPAIGGPYTYNHNQMVSIEASPLSGNVFDHWEVSAGSNVTAMYAPSTMVAMDVSKTVTAVFRLGSPYNLTMAVSPAGAGTTTPAIGTNPKMHGETVTISAAPAVGGNVFVHWKVSNGSPVADPTSLTTTVTIDASKTVTAEFKPAPQFRAFWAPVFQDGMQNKDQVDAMIAKAVQGNYNAIVAQVLAHHDAPDNAPAHGAFWRSNIVPQSSYVTETFDPLAYLLEQAHLNGLEVHAWMVAFRVTTETVGGVSGWPPQDNAYLAAHPEFLMSSRATTGWGPTVLGSGSTKSYILDPGSPEVQEYLISIVRELVSSYQIDGIHWDYIRYDVGTTGDGGYPASNTYQNSGLARFRRIYNTAPDYLPPITADANWDDFRRRSITELIRRTQAEIESIPNPRQPLRHTASVVTWGDAPADFSGSGAWSNFSNWEEWMRLGFLDAGVPMCYYREHETQEGNNQKLWYRNWVKACLDWRYQRHMYIGQANYLNHMPNSLTQMRYALHTADEEPGRSADGIVNYDYYYTKFDTQNDYTWYTDPANVRSVFADPAALPTMPWRSPTTATEGRLWGRVMRAGLPVDNATVTLSAVPPISVTTDGNGVYVITMIPATGAGTGYQVSAAAGGQTSLPRNVQIIAGSTQRQDLEVTPTAILEWRSVRTHAGTARAMVLKATNESVESRQGGLQRIEVDFDRPIELSNSSGVQVFGSTTTGGVPGEYVEYTPTAVTRVDADTLAISLDAGLLPDRTLCYVLLAADAVSPPLAEESYCALRALVGDTTANGTVNLGDALLVRARSGASVAENPGLDVDLDGTIGPADVAAIKPLVTSPPATVLWP